MPNRLLKILDKVTPGTSRSLGWEVLLTAISFPASILLNRTLGAEDRGLLAIIILIPSTVFIIGSCQWDRILQSGITSKEFSGREAWRRTLYYSFWLSVIFIPLGVIVSLIYDKLSISDRWLSVIYMVNFPIYFLGGCLAAIYVASGSIDGQYQMRIGLQGSYLTLLIILLLSNQLSVSSMIAIYILMHLVSLLTGLKQKKRLLRGEVSTDRPPISSLAKSFFPYLLESLSTRIDIWAFSLLASLSALGQYTSITALMLPVGLLENAMLSGSIARLDWTNPEIVTRYLSRMLLVMVFLLFSLGIGGIFLGPYLLDIVLGKSFASGYWMIPWITVIVVTQSASVQFHTMLRLSGNTRAYFTIQSIEPFVRLFLVSILGLWLSTLGIMLGIIISSFLKIVTCFISFKLQPSHVV